MGDLLHLNIFNLVIYITILNNNNNSPYFEFFLQKIDIFSPQISPIKCIKLKVKIKIYENKLKNS
jgi:hypothetical protein